MSDLLQPGSLLSVVGILICAATVFGFAGRYWWVFDLCAHFRAQYFVALSFILVLMLFDKRYGTSTAFAFCAAANLGCLLPYHLTSQISKSNAPRVWRVISGNVLSINSNFDLVKRFILENQADVVLLMEVNHQWIEALRELAVLYPYQKFEPCKENFGIAIYSKHPPIACEIIYLGQAGLPSLVGEFDVAGKRLTLLGTHPSPPMSAAMSLLRNDQVEAIATYLAAVPEPKILLGDLNMSPWSHSFKCLLATTGLTDSAKGR
ncbi:MAG: endonuclease/exonuclease/phosphatase family protein, partial [Acidobacteria bacterium]|nr:endonuclease/exonuclease/phosphatase family protein [Acidobacteriota bacterium]